MDNQAYLEQIAAKPTKGSSAGGLFSPKMLKIVFVGLAAIILVIALGAMFGAKGSKGKELAETLSIRLPNISQTIRNYNTHIKSPELRAMAITLQSSLDATSRDLAPLLVSEFKHDPKKPTTKVVNTEAELMDELTNTLTDAKLNGILDRVYANRLTAEISDLIYIESDLHSKTSSSAVKDLLDKSSSDLRNLHEDFFNFANSY